MHSTVPIEADDLPPPPYSADSIPASPTAPGQTEYPITTNVPARASLRGGYVRRTSLASNHSSAAAYFDERPCALQLPSNVLEHRLFCPAGTARESIGFPEPEDSYRARDVRIEDWCTFLNYLFSARSDRVSEKTEHGANLEQKSLPIEEDTPKRRERIEAVVAEWNEGFFGPRGIKIHCEIPSSQAPPYMSTPDLSTARDVPSRPYAQQPQPQPQSRRLQSFDQGENVSEQHRNERCGRPSHRRSKSVSSTSSSSSSSSDDSIGSIGSISSRDLDGSNLSHVQATIASLRKDRALKSDLKASFQQLRADLKAQRRAMPRHERKQFSRELKSELLAQKHDIKKEVKALVKEFKAARKAGRKAKKAERKTRRAERRARRRGDGCGSGSTLAQGDVHHDVEARAREVTARMQEVQLAAQERATEMQMRGQENAIRTREEALEKVARAREANAQAREKMRESESVARERIWREGKQVNGVVERD